MEETIILNNRHDQLRSIAEVLEAELFYIKDTLDHHVDCDKGICTGYQNSYEKNIHKLRGYCEQLKIIASEIKEKEIICT